MFLYVRELHPFQTVYSPMSPYSCVVIKQQDILKLLIKLGSLLFASSLSVVLDSACRLRTWHGYNSPPCH